MVQLSGRKVAIYRAQSTENDATEHFWSIESRIEQFVIANISQLRHKQIYPYMHLGFP